MKNSEMKTIIRHIDRLTRNLNARGRRRYADNALELDKARSNVRHENALIDRIGSSIVFNSQMNDRLAQKMGKRSFELIKDNAEGLLKKECKEVVTRLKTLIKYCDIAINATDEN